jgi:hypothetical protein
MKYLCEIVQRKPKESTMRYLNQFVKDPEVVLPEIAKAFQYDKQTIEELNAYYDWLEESSGEQYDIPEDWE